MLAGDQAFLQFAGAGWAYAFSAGILSMKLPLYALFGTAAIVLLGLPARDTLRGNDNPRLDKSLLVLAAILSVAATPYRSPSARRSRRIPIYPAGRRLVRTVRAIRHAAVSRASGASHLAIARCHVPTGTPRHRR